MREGVVVFRVAVLVAVLTGCAAEPPREDRVVVDIGGRPVTVAEFDRFVASSVQKDQPFLAGDVMKALFEQFIEEQLLLKAADEASVRADPDTVARRVAVIRNASSEDDSPPRDARLAGIIERQVRIETLLEQKLFAELAVSEEEIASQFEDNRSFYQRPETVSVSQILVGARDDAESILGELRADPALFPELAERHSTGPEASRSGLLGNFGRGELPPSIEGTVFSLNENQVSEVVETDFGFHIFRVEEKSQATALPLEAVRDTIRVDLLRQKSADGLDRYVEELKEIYPVTIHREHLSFAFLEWENGEAVESITEASP